MIDLPKNRPSDNRALEIRIFRLSIGIVSIGSAATFFLFSLTIAISFLAGGALAMGSAFWLRDAMNAIVLRDQKATKRRALAGFLLRLLLIPLCLYAMIRFLFLSAAAVAIGFAAAYCSIFVEGILEALNCGPGKNARTE